MPVYEFVCRDCSHHFSELCRLDWQGTVKCPACGGSSLSKAISQFSGAGSPDGAGNQAGCGSCSGKNCAGCR
ncbi:MAG: zinc ribbon domain-containing protein [Negativicutes bacterium]|nr:zinc ribbon domain-containing protein [Negativicutes bacterium]